MLYITMDKVRILNCNRCLHEWATRMEQEPKYCPKCKNQYWNKERAKRKKYNPCPKDKQFFVKNYVELKKSTFDIAKEFNFYPRTVYERVKSFNIHRSRKEALKLISGEKHFRWKGDKVSYDALHDYITHHKPKPELCEECKKVPPRELANISGEYKRDLNDFRWLCYFCHRKQDKEAVHQKFLAKKMKNGLVVCSHCKLYKPFLNFYKHRGNRLGIGSYCKECIKQMEHKK